MCALQLRSANLRGRGEVVESVDLVLDLEGAGRRLENLKVDKGFQLVVIKFQARCRGGLIRLMGMIECLATSSAKV